MSDLKRIADTFPGRNRQGYVVGFYVYGGYVGGGQRQAGPFPTEAEAQELTAGFPDGHVLCGPVFSAEGKVVRAPRQQPRRAPVPNEDE